MKRSGYLWFRQGIDLNKAGLEIKGYGTTGDFVCRLEINGAGVKVFAGEKGVKTIAEANWEQLVEKLSA
jgi:hypothetical protein